jgi:hypothetical protein
MFNTYFFRGFRVEALHLNLLTFYNPILERTLRKSLHLQAGKQASRGC